MTAWAAAPRRWGVAVATGLHGVVFAALAWGAASFSVLLAVGLGALALAHALCAVAAGLAPARLPRAWAVLALTSFAIELAAALSWFSALGYLSGVYEGLGAELEAALTAVFASSLALTVPLAAWASAEALRSSARLQRAVVALLAASVALVVAAAWWSQDAGRAEPVKPLVALSAEAELAELEPLARIWRRLPRVRGGPRPLMTTEPVRCKGPITTESVALVATFVSRRGGKRGKVQSLCVQADDLASAVDVLAERLRKGARRAPIKLDVIRGVHDLGRFASLSALELRPGLDGACHAERCSMPWQLLSQGVFSTYRPVATIPDFQFGVEAARLWQALGRAEAPEAGLVGLSRVTTSSYVARNGRLVKLARMRRADVPLTAKSLRAAGAAAERHVLGAQLPDGKFRYTLDPLSGEADTAQLSLPRQAGVTLALCELGAPKHQVDVTIRRSLSLMQSLMQQRGDVFALTYAPEDTWSSLGQNALPLVAFLACSERARFEFDEAIARLSPLILRLQREDGGFHPGFDLAQGRVAEGRDPLYATGQAVLALVLLEQRQRERPSSALPPPEVLASAAERAMRYYGGPYWSHPLRDFFFLEENWHCLAARAALGVHENEAYERLCLDYVRFKSRLVLEPSSGVAADFEGGFGFGNLVPPHNTGAAGLGEALAAALAIERARGLDTTANVGHLRRVLGFLLRQQWSPDNCFACATPEVLGAMSEHTHSALTRIDFVQHAWAALGHGARMLELDAVTQARGAATTP